MSKICGKCGRDFGFGSYRMIDASFKKVCFAKEDDIQNICLSCLCEMARKGTLKLKNSENYTDMITGKKGACLLHSSYDQRYELEKDTMLEFLKSFNNAEKYCEFQKMIHQNYAKNKNKYKIAITYQKSGYVEVYGRDLEEALKWAKDHVDDFELSDDDDYVDGSYMIDEESTWAVN